MVIYTLVLVLCAALEHTMQAAELPGTGTSSPHVITFFFKPKEAIPATLPQDELLSYINTPSKFHYALLQQHRAAETTAGIYILYAGGITYSDSNGQVTVPRIQESDELTMIITARISPVVTHGNTVDYFTLKDGYPAQVYHSRRVNSTTTGQLVWSITEQPLTTIRIPSFALVILAPPEAVILPDQECPAEPGPNLILPDIRIDGYIHTFAPALNTIPISRFFAQFHTWLARTDGTYARIIT